MSRPPYDYRNCQSLFGYAARVHARSGGACQLCDADGGSARFDFWRQLSVEHLIGESQGGYLREIKTAVASRFPELVPAEAATLVEQLDELNTVTACQFCNSTTSRTRTDVSMSELIGCAESPEGAIADTRRACEEVLEAKRSDVAWKLNSVRKAYDELIVQT